MKYFLKLVIHSTPTQKTIKYVQKAYIYIYIFLNAADDRNRRVKKCQGCARKLG